MNWILHYRENEPSDYHPPLVELGDYDLLPISDLLEGPEEPEEPEEPGEPVYFSSVDLQCHFLQHMPNIQSIKLQYKSPRRSEQSQTWNNISILWFKFGVVHLPKGLELYNVHLRSIHLSSNSQSNKSQSIKLRKLLIAPAMASILRYKLVFKFFVPTPSLAACKAAIFATGTGRYPRTENYTECCWVSTGNGQFCPGDKAQPHLGTVGELEEVQEARVKTLCMGEHVHGGACGKGGGTGAEEASLITNLAICLSLVG